MPYPRRLHAHTSASCRHEVQSEKKGRGGRVWPIPDRPNVRLRRSGVGLDRAGHSGTCAPFHGHDGGVALGLQVSDAALKIWRAISAR